MLRSIDSYTGNSSNESKSSGKSSKREIPSHIKNFQPKQKHLNKSYTDAREKSNFLITVNTNISYNQLSEDARETLYFKLEDFMNELEGKFRSGDLLKVFGNGVQGRSDAGVEKYEFGIEYGSQKSLLHSHAILILNKKCHIDLKNANEYLEEFFSDVHEKGKKPYLNVRNFVDAQKMVETYITKTGQEPTEM